MSASLTTMREFIEGLRLRVPPEIHPSAQGIVRQHLDDACYADAHGDLATVHRLLDLVGRKIADELRWEADKSATPRIKDYREAYRLRRRADRFEARFNLLRGK
jgi:hypothetical protein